MVPLGRHGSEDGRSITSPRTHIVRSPSHYGPDHSSHIWHWATGTVSQIQKADILLTHGPPIRQHDLTMTSVRAGCPTLWNKVSLTQPRLHLFGHIHEGRGATLHRWNPAGEETAKITAFVNGANSPIGRGTKAWDPSGRRRLPGEPGWQPVIVDMRD